jgi:hypothetical protein
MQQSKGSISPLVVRESKTMNILLGLLMIMMCYFMAYGSSITPTGWKSHLLFIFSLIFPGFMFWRAWKNHVCIVIDHAGIWYYGELITSWERFKKAFVDEEAIPGRTADNFKLFVQYYKPGVNGYFTRKLPLTVSQDRSEEEIIEAIRIFSGLASGKFQEL